MKRSLLLVLGLVLLKQLVWLAVLPVWQTPDEPAHFHYVQYLAETGKIPVYHRNQPVNVSAEETSRLERVSYLNSVAFRPDNRPRFSGTLVGPGEERFSQDPPLSRLNDGNSSAAIYGPGYYGVAAGVYRLLGDRTVIDRVFAVRAVSILFILSITAMAFFLAGELWGGGFVPAMFALVVGFQPMLSMLGVSVNNDAMLVAIASGALLLLSVQLRKGLGLWGGLLMGLLIGLGAVTKPQMIYFLALVPGVTVLLGLFRRTTWRQAGLYLGAMAVPILLTLGPWMVYSHSTYGSWMPPPVGADHPQAISFLHYLKQALIEPGTYRFHDLWVVMYWANFGWLDTTFAPGVYKVLGAVGIVSFIGSLVWLRDPGRPGRALLVGAMLVVVSFMAFLYVAEFQFVKQTGGMILQGRYMFPVLLASMIVLFGGCLALAPPRRQEATAAALAWGVILLNLASLLRIVERYYV